MGTHISGFKMSILCHILVVSVITLFSGMDGHHTEDEHTVFCSKWTGQKTVHVGPDTVATLRSTVDQIRRCTVIFKLRKGCNEMRLGCSKFNVPRGPGRLFLARALGPQARRQYYNGRKPNGVISRDRLRVIYRGKGLNELTCRVICKDKDPESTEPAPAE